MVSDPGFRSWRQTLDSGRGIKLWIRVVASNPDSGRGIKPWTQVVASNPDSGHGVKPWTQIVASNPGLKPLTQVMTLSRARVIGLLDHSRLHTNSFGIAELTQAI